MTIIPLDSCVGQIRQPEKIFSDLREARRTYKRLYKKRPVHERAMLRFKSLFGETPRTRYFKVRKDLLADYINYLVGRGEKTSAYDKEDSRERIFHGQASKIADKVQSSWPMTD